MSRDLPSGFAAAASAAKVAPVFLVRLDWPSGTVFVWTGYGNIAWDGQTWIGTGDLGRVSDVRESREGAANGLTLSLHGIPSGNIAQALADDSQGRPGKMWLGFLAADGSLVVDPYLIFDGVIDVCPVEDDAETCIVSVQLEKELIDSRARGRRYTHEDQKIQYPTDRGFEYIAGLQDKQIVWGVASPAPQAAGADDINNVRPYLTDIS